MAAVAEMVQALEAARIDACATTDHPAPDAEWLHSVGHDALDPFAALSFVAAASTKLLVQTGIVVLPYRSPFVTAKAAATLQVLSGGRLILGVAVGYQKTEFEALGVDFHRRGALTDEALEVIRRVWEGGTVVMKGSTYNARGNEARPAPRPTPPIWIGGTARWADGWYPFYSNAGMGSASHHTGVESLDHLRELIARLHEHRAALGKTGPFDVVLGPRMRIKQPTRAAAQRFIDELQELKEAGVTWASVNIAHPSRAAYIELVRWFGEEVIPHCQGMTGEASPAVSNPPA
jgi:probable F420-dependent oxidoreductase